MNSQTSYSIAFKGLSQGKHIFEYTVTDDFFAEFDGGVVEKGNVNARVTLEKQSALMILWFDLEGTVALQCDRCLETYNQPIKSSEKVFVKFGEKEFVDGDDVIWVSTNDYQLNVSQLIYEFICLAIPIKRVHPKDEKGISTCNAEMIEKLEKYIVKEGGAKTSAWDGLKELLDNE